MPSDIDPQSGFRLPLPRREELDEAGQKAYDRGATPGANITGLQGPAGVPLYSPRTAAHLSAINRYLRFEAGISPRVREIAILVTAREMDSQFEWVAHEGEALKEGVERGVIDVIRG
jgi:4-carboxymuconolactone decarboxylase